MTDRRTRLAIVPLLALLVLPACAWVNAPPTLAVEGRLARYGVQVQRAAQALRAAAVLAPATGALAPARPQTPPPPGPAGRAGASASGKKANAWPWRSVRLTQRGAPGRTWRRRC